tara:strand:- start:91 stop:708 length:618 start_codon:yes stop_codon:yes gene_type:complete
MFDDDGLVGLGPNGIVANLQTDDQTNELAALFIKIYLSQGLFCEMLYRIDVEPLLGIDGEDDEDDEYDEFKHNKSGILFKTEEEANQCFIDLVQRARTNPRIRATAGWAAEWLTSRGHEDIVYAKADFIHVQENEAGSKRRRQDDEDEDEDEDEGQRKKQKKRSPRELRTLLIKVGYPEADIVGLPMWRLENMAAEKGVLINCSL